MQTIVWHAIGSLVTNVDLNAHSICNFPPFMHRGFQILFHYLPVLYPEYPSVQYLRVVYARTHCDFNKLNHIFMTIIILSERGICDGVFNLFGFTMYFHLNQFASQRFAHTAGFAAKRVYCQFSTNIARGRKFTWYYYYYYLSIINLPGRKI